MLILLSSCKGFRARLADKIHPPRVSTDTIKTLVLKPVEITIPEVQVGETFVSNLFVDTILVHLDTATNIETSIEIKYPEVSKKIATTEIGKKLIEAMPDLLDAKVKVKTQVKIPEQKIKDSVEVEKKEIKTTRVKAPKSNWLWKFFTVFLSILVLFMIVVYFRKK